jgi:hypothetical protein
MLVQHQHPGIGSAPLAEHGARPLRTVIGDIVKRFLRATQPPARAGAGLGASAVSRVVRAVLWVNLQFAAILGIGVLYLAGKARVGLDWARYAVPFAIIATTLVLLKGIYRALLVPFHHVALSIVAAMVAIEALLVGRLFVQLAYEDRITGVAGTVLTLTDPLVAPFTDLEGTYILHDTGVVQFATLTAMEAYLVGTIVFVIALLFWSEFLHMYRRVATYFYERSERRKRSVAEPEQPVPEPELAPLAAATEMTAASDLSVAS